jgi:hypothetical protein
MNTFTNALSITIRQNKKTFTLMILAFVVSFFGAKDFTTATSAYRSLELDKPINFLIKAKYNKVKREIFPDLKYSGILIELKEAKEIGVSRGDFDKCKVGDTITIFKLKSEDAYMTQYEIDNQGFIKIWGKPFSFVIIPTLISFLVGLIILFFLIKKSNLK